MLHILEWLVYFAKCTKWHIKNESNKDWMERQHLQGTLWEKKRAETEKQPSKRILTKRALRGNFHAFLFYFL